MQAGVGVLLNASEAASVLPANAPNITASPSPCVSSAPQTVRCEWSACAAVLYFPKVSIIGFNCNAAPNKLLSRQCIGDVMFQVLPLFSIGCAMHCTSLGTVSKVFLLCVLLKS